MNSAKCDAPLTTTPKLLGRLLRSVTCRLGHYSFRAEYRCVERRVVHLAGEPAVRIPTHTSRAELYALYQLANQCRPGAVALEIGSYLGASACFLAAGLDSLCGHLICVDEWQNETMPDGPRDTYGDFLRNTHGVSRLVTPIRKNSRELTSTDIHSPLDLVFIDGDHGYPSVQQDFALVSQSVHTGGTIAFHDAVHFPGVTRVIGEALATGDWILSGWIENLLWMVKR